MVRFDRQPDFTSGDELYWFDEMLRCHNGALTSLIVMDMRLWWKDDDGTYYALPNYVQRAYMEWSAEQEILGL